LTSQRRGRNKSRSKLVLKLEVGRKTVQKSEWRTG
jgi:hypothetical protein